MSGLPRPPSSQPRPLDTLPRPLAAEPAQAAPRQQEPWRRQPAPATPIGVATPSPPEEGDEAIGLPPALTRDLFVWVGGWVRTCVRMHSGVLEFRVFLARQQRIGKRGGPKGCSASLGNPSCDLIHSGFVAFDCRLVRRSTPLTASWEPHLSHGLIRVADVASSLQVGLGAESSLLPCSVCAFALAISAKMEHRKSAARAYAEGQGRRNRRQVRSLFVRLGMPPPQGQTKNKRRWKGKGEKGA